MTPIKLSKILTLLFFFMYSFNVSASDIICEEVKKYFDKLTLDIYKHYGVPGSYTNYSIYIDSIFNGSCVSIESIVEKFALSGAKRYNSYMSKGDQCMFDLKLFLFVEENNIEIINILKNKDDDFIYNFFYFYLYPVKYMKRWPRGIREEEKFSAFAEKYDRNIRKILLEAVSDINEEILK
ncbi:MAG: hypothetical protein ACE364_04970 [Chlorobiota bacterium]